jgi:hypothetical protein
MWVLDLPAVSGSSTATCGAEGDGPTCSSLHSQGGLKEMPLLWLSEMFMSIGGSLVAKKKSAVAIFRAEK